VQLDICELFHSDPITSVKISSTNISKMNSDIILES